MAVAQIADKPTLDVVLSEVQGLSIIKSIQKGVTEIPSAGAVVVDITISPVVEGKTVINIPSLVTRATSSVLSGSLTLRLTSPTNLRLETFGSFIGDPGRFISWEVVEYT